MRRLLVLLVTVALVGGCGGEDDSDDGASRSESDSKPPSLVVGPEGRPVQPDVDDAKAVADAAVLTLGDFEPGWRAGEPVGFGDEDPCRAFDSDDELVDVSSEEFRRDYAAIENMVTVYKDEAAASALFDLFQSDETAGCVRRELEDVFRLEAEQDPEIDDMTVEFGPVSIEPYGDETAAYQAVLTLESEELTVDVYIDIVLVRVGRSTALFLLTDVLAPLEEPRGAVISAVVNRLTDELFA